MSRLFESIWSRFVWALYNCLLSSRRRSTTWLRQNCARAAKHQKQVFLYRHLSAIMMQRIIALTENMSWYQSAYFVAAIDGLFCSQRRVIRFMQPLCYRFPGVMTPVARLRCMGGCDQYCSSKFITGASLFSGSHYVRGKIYLHILVNKCIQNVCALNWMRDNKNMTEDRWILISSPPVSRATATSLHQLELLTEAARSTVQVCWREFVW